MTEVKVETDVAKESVITVVERNQLDGPADSTLNHQEEADESPCTKLEDTSTKGEMLDGADVNPSVDIVDPAVIEFMLTQLARQLEYYLSSKNLSKDTYVQTLRNLNDGCVPVSILANFSKVKGILLTTAGIVDEASRRHAVCDAATQYSSKLRVANIDTKTGKEIPNNGENAEDERLKAISTILALGTVDNEPIDLSNDQPPSSTSDFANAIVMRDVAPEVTAEDIHSLFQYEGCPAVISITPDVANCWFVQLDTTSRADVMAVLLQLRSETLAGYPVHARIKTSVAASVVPIDPAPFMAPVDLLMGPQRQQGKNKNGSPEQSRRKKKNKNKKKSGSGGNSNDKNNDKNNSKNNSSSNGGNKKNSSNSNPGSTPSKKKNIVPPPPALSEDNFPTLLDNRVEWDTASPMQDDEKNGKDIVNENVIVDKDGKLEDDEDPELKSSKLCSDSASTATTTSSSTEPGPKKIGYAAALKTVKTDDSSSSSNTSTHHIAVAKVQESPKPTSPDTVTNIKQIQEHMHDIHPPVQVKPPIWGRGRTFADILRQPQTAV
ncbi:hypothetical protein ACA910_016017 [Epithemia clementina (nom. ined.)]